MSGYSGKEMMMYRVVLGGLTTEPGSFEEALMDREVLQAQEGDGGYLEVGCEKHGWSPVTTEGDCLLCDDEDYEDWIATREDALAMMYP